MTFGEAVQTCFRRYAQFSGRARRPEFWWFVLFLFLAGVVLTVVNSLLFGPTVSMREVTTVAADGTTTTDTTRAVSYDGGWLGLVFNLATIVPLLAVTWRRLHDTGRAGWWALVPSAIVLVTVVGGLAATVGIGAALGAVGEADMALLAGAGLFVLAALLLSLAAWIWLVAVLARAGMPGPNRFGPEPIDAEIPA